jgi:hypothetical protein
MSVTDGRPARPRLRWIWRIVALATAAILAAPAAWLVGLRQGLHHEYGPVTVYHHAITAVRVSATGDTVAITAGRPGRVSVSSALGWFFTKPAVREIWHGTTLAVSVYCPVPGPFGRCSANLILHVPAAVGVRVAVGTGTATVTGLAGPVHVTATSGSLALGNLAGPLWATATSGSITGMTGLNSPTVTADVRSGSLALGFDRAPSSLRLAVGSGSGIVTVPPGTRYRLDPGLSSGVVHMSHGMSSPDSAGLIAARVGSGTLSIGYQSAPPAGSR